MLNNNINDSQNYWTARAVQEQIADDGYVQKAYEETSLAKTVWQNSRIQQASEMQSFESVIQRQFNTAQRLSQSIQASEFEQNVLSQDPSRNSTQAMAEASLQKIFSWQRQEIGLAQANFEQNRLDCKMSSDNAAIGAAQGDLLLKAQDESKDRGSQMQKVADREFLTQKRQEEGRSQTAKTFAKTQASDNHKSNGAKEAVEKSVGPQLVSRLGIDKMSHAVNGAKLAQTQKMTEQAEPVGADKNDKGTHSSNGMQTALKREPLMSTFFTTNNENKNEHQHSWRRPAFEDAEELSVNGSSTNRQSAIVEPQTAMQYKTVAVQEVLMPRMLELVQKLSTLGYNWARVVVPVDSNTKVVVRFNTQSGKVKIHLESPTSELCEMIRSGWQSLKAVALQQGIDLDDPTFEINS